MEGTYGVYFGKDPVGKVQVRRQGLYYYFACRCRISGDVVCRLQIRCGDTRENLGIPVPVEDGFGLNTKLPVKRLGQGKPEFFLVPRHEKTEGTFAPIYPDEPFAYIGRLKEAFLVKKDGQLGICI